MRISASWSGRTDPPDTSIRRGHPRRTAGSFLGSSSQSSTILELLQGYSIIRDTSVPTPRASRPGESPSRRGLATLEPVALARRRPALTASARGRDCKFAVGTEKRFSVEQRNNGIKLG
jgi:hypothetical protein